MSLDSGSGKTKNQTATSTSAPWGPIQKPATGAIQDLTKLYKSGGFNIPRYQGDTLADTAPETTAGWNSITSTANDPNSGVGQALKANNAILSGDYSAIQPLIDAARNNAGMSYEAAGRYGSGYHDNAVAQGTGTVLANALQGAIGAAPGLQAASYAPGQALLGVGEQRQQAGQNEINEAIKAYYADKQQPISNIEDFMSALGGNWGGTSTQTSPVPTNGGTSWQDMFGAGSSLAGLGLQAFNTFGKAA